MKLVCAISKKLIFFRKQNQKSSKDAAKRPQDKPTKNAQSLLLLIASVYLFWRKSEFKPSDERVKALEKYSPVTSG